MISKSGHTYAWHTNRILNTGIKIPVSQSLKRKQKLRDIQKLKISVSQISKIMGGNLRK